MFTGIVSAIGVVRDAVPADGGLRLCVETTLSLEDTAIGASIACSGTCLTIVEKGNGWFAADLSPETLSCTTFRNARAGMRLNLERALRVGDELGGHLVTGHVDGIAEVTAIEPNGENRVANFAPEDATLLRFIAPKGSITLDGVSLTVNAVKDGRFTVSLIPHTLKETTLGELETGDSVNLEIDLLARYVARLHDSLLRGGKADAAIQP